MDREDRLNGFLTELKQIVSTVDMKSASAPLLPPPPPVHPPKPDRLKLMVEKIASIVSTGGKVTEESTKKEVAGQSYLAVLESMSSAEGAKSDEEIEIEGETMTVSKIVEKVTEQVQDNLQKRHVLRSRMKYAGGGSVAKQFARGGTMGGDLRVEGTITATEGIIQATSTSISSVSSSFTITQTTDFIVLCDCTSGDITVQLPEASNYSSKLSIKKVDSTSNVVTVSGYNAETVDGSNVATIGNQYTSISLINNNNSWFIV